MCIYILIWLLILLTNSPLLYLLSAKRRVAAAAHDINS